jgi:hypothetical protein
MSDITEEKHVGSTVWQSQPSDAPRISLEFVRHQAEQLNSAWRWEQRKGIGATIATVVFLIVLAFPPRFFPKDWAFLWSLRAGVFLLTGAAVYLLFSKRRRGRLVTADNDISVVHTLDAVRSELQRRRDYYLGNWRWSIWPVIPAMVVVFVGTALYDPRPGKLIRVFGVLGGALVATLLEALYKNGKGRKYQRELDALASLDKN